MIEKISPNTLLIFINLFSYSPLLLSSVLLYLAQRGILCGENSESHCEDYALPLFGLHLRTQILRSIWALQGKYLNTFQDLGHSA